MCIISGDGHISQTKIFVAPCADSSYQFTVYCNKVALESKDGTMILPYKTSPSNPHCVLIDMSTYKDLFDDLDAQFPVARSLSFRDGMVSSNNSLAVQNIGSYKASIVPTLGDFFRLDFSTFPVSPNVYDFLTKNYPYQYGFIVCRLVDTQKYHPFGYISPLINQSMFIPTKHYHTHSNGTMTADWDHSIYIVNGTLPNKSGRYTNQWNSRMKWDKLPKLSNIKCMNRYMIYAPNANYPMPNEDITVNCM